LIIGISSRIKVHTSRALPSFSNTSVYNPSFFVVQRQKFNVVGGAKTGELIHTSLGGLGVVPGDEAV
jgi:hypothetical protein